MNKFQKIIFSVYFLIVCFSLFFFYSRGFIPHDEGWIINPAQRITEGDFPYRDFHYIYTPALAYLIAIGFKLFGMSILVSRLITMAASMLTIYIIYKITQEITKKTYAYIIPISLYVAWLPIHINFAWPVVYAILGGLLTCLLLLNFRKKKLSSLILAAGITTGLTILFKQNFGLALVLNNFIFFYFERKLITKKNLLFYFLGVIFLPSLMLVYFYFNNALIPFLNDMNFYMFQQLLLKGSYSTPFIYPDIWYRQMVKTLLYLSPLILSIAAAKCVFKKNKSLVFLATFCGFYYILSIRPITDLIHLVPLLSLTGIPLLLLITYYKDSKLRIGSFLVFLTLTAIGIYSALYMNYYRWNTPIINQNAYTANKRLGVLTDELHHHLIPEITDYVQNNSKPDSFIFIYSYSPSYYFLTDRKNPTKFIWFTSLSNDDQMEILQNLSTKNATLILTDHDIYSEKSILATYIKLRYNLAKKIGNYTIWQRSLSL